MSVMPIPTGLDALGPGSSLDITPIATSSATANQATSVGLGGAFTVGGGGGADAWVPMAMVVVAVLGALWIMRR